MLIRLFPNSWNRLQAALLRAFSLGYALLIIFAVGAPSAFSGAAACEPEPEAKVLIVIEDYLSRATDARHARRSRVHTSLDSVRCLRGAACSKHRLGNTLAAYLSPHRLLDPRNGIGAALLV